MPLPNLPSLQAADRSAAAAEVASIEPPPVPGAGVPSAGGDAGTAEASLQRAAERTGLSELQLARIEESRRLIASGNFGLATELTRQLNAELDAAATGYTVVSGDNLWRIAEKPTVYGNGYLWPLIWRANTDRLKQPYQLYKGMQLRVPTNPTVADVAAALDYSHRNAGEGMPPAADLPAAASAGP